MNAHTAFLDGDRAEIASLNNACFCLQLARADIDAAILADTAIANMDVLLRDRPNLFASTGVFLATSDLDAMLDQIHAIEAAADQPAYQRAALARTDCVLTGIQPQTRGAFMGYDFHVTPQGPRLIEINTNAGGAFLVQALSQAVQKDAIRGYVPFGAKRFEERICEMMRAEWRAAGRFGLPKTLAIVDDDPSGQYLYPDMLLAKAILNDQGIKTIIVDSRALTFGPLGLKAGDQLIDMVYNRLTDFALEQPQSKALRTALLQDQVVVTPSPRHHALYADKRNLAFLCDVANHKALSLSYDQMAALKTLPDTVEVTPDRATELWAARKGLFFKPVGGFGGAAAYRGDKLTRRVWGEILSGDYVTQAFVPPPIRGVTTEAGTAHLKFDIRVYSYAGEPLLLAARVYQGQTTNFRTAGGGFAPVIMADV